jgi:DNA primase large subunit
MPRVKDKLIVARPFHGNVLRYCMQKALEEGMPLTGSGGHLFRLAIACEGRAIGMTVESVAQLFQKQKDFNYDKSLQKSREPWDYDYSPWSCEKIQDQCGSIVKGYCRSCPFNHANGEKVEA